MFSGNETQLTESERTYPTQWALNPTAYQNVANDQVDWAALAHQWIMMKESCPPEQVPSAPPPPPIGPLQSNSNVSASNTSLIEGGEAPMEVEDDKDEVKTSISPSASAPPPTWSGSASTSTNWNWQQQWGWNSSWSGPQGATGPTNSITSNSVTGKSPLLPSPYPFPGQTADSSTGSTFSSFTGVRATGYNSGYWTTANDQPRPRVPNKLKSRRLINSDEEVEQQSTVTLDAAKRRQLPAWIREGLEKMEREKQKQLEKEREVREREEYLKRKKEEEEHVRKVMTDSGIVTLPTKSKFDSDSDEFEHTDGMALKQNSSPMHFKNILNTVSPEPTNILKSKEERVQDVMLNVRRLMTEILLDVTTDEIDKICREEMKRYQGSASAMNLQKTPALASLSGKLGLDIYGDSGSSESDSDASNRNDSDSELKEKIRQRKTEFSRTEQEIEARVSEAEREQAEREQNSWRKADESDGSDRDTQVDTAQSHHGDLEKSPTRKMRHHDTQFSISLNKHVSPTNVEKVIIGSKKSIEELTRRDSLKSHSDNKNQIRDNSSTSSSRSRSSSTENSHTQSSDSSSDSDSDSSNFNSYKKSSVNRSSTHCKTKKNNNSLSTRGRDSQSSSSETRKFDKDFKNPSNSRSHKDHENYSKKYVPESNIVNYDEKGDMHENQPDRRCNINNRVKYSQSPKRTCHSSYSSKGHNSRSNTTRRSRSREKRTRSRSRDHRLGRSHSKEHDRRDKSRERKRDRSRSQDRDRSRSKNRRRSRSRDKRRSRSRDRKRSRSRSLRRSKKFRRH